MIEFGKLEFGGLEFGGQRASSAKTMDSLVVALNSRRRKKYQRTSSLQ
jgi:hypothetical protein